jgi:hypothetical protein
MARLNQCKRFIAFLDVLGFRELLKDADFEKKVQQIVDALEERTEYDRVRHPYLSYLAISDTVIVTAEEEHSADLLWKICQLQNKLLLLGFCVRGGISFGDVLFYGKPPQNLFGQTLVNAYNNEIERAIYPRVVIDATIEKMIRSDVEARKPGRDDIFLLRDPDGVMFVNQFGRDIVNSNSRRSKVRDQVPENKKLYVEAIRRGLKTSDTKAKMKWRWLSAQCDTQLAKF